VTSTSITDAFATRYGSSAACCEARGTVGACRGSDLEGYRGRAPSRSDLEGYRGRDPSRSDLEGYSVTPCANRPYAKRRPHHWPRMECSERSCHPAGPAGCAAGGDAESKGGGGGAQDGRRTRRHGRAV
jgi:hypothetical protein